MSLPVPLTALPRLVLGAQLVSTGGLFGLIWFVQRVHYPLFLRIDPEDFIPFEAEHARRTGWVAAPLMLLELASSLLLLSRRLSPAAITPQAARWGAALTLLTWASTFFVQVPLHNRLHRIYDRRAIQRLVATNWVRTALWSLRMALVTYWVLR